MKKALVVILHTLLLLGCANPTLTPTLEPTATSVSRVTLTVPAVAPTVSVAVAEAIPTASYTPAPAPSAAPSQTPLLSATPSPMPSAQRVLPTLTVTLKPTQPVPTAIPSTIPTAVVLAWPYISNLVVTPDERPRLYVAVGDGLFSSDDYGANWRRVDLTGVPQGARVNSVALDHRHPATLYVTSSEGIYRREGEGSWNLVNTLKATALTVDLANPNVLWAGIAFTTEHNAILLKSSDAGRTWGKADLGMSGGRNTWVNQILIDPQNPNILYANVRNPGRFGWPQGWLYRGGQVGRWEELPISAVRSGEGACEPSSLAFDPNLRRLYVGCDAYYYNMGRLVMLQSDSPHAVDAHQAKWAQAASFGQLGQSVAMGTVRPLAVDARVPKALYAAVTDLRSVSGGYYQQNLLVSHDEGGTWRVLPANGLPGSQGPQ